MKPHDLPGDEPLPDWAQTLMARLDNQIATRPQRLSEHPDLIPTRFTCTAYLPLKALVDEAAARRGIGRSSYVRRALAAMVAYDLDLSFPQVAQYLPYPCPPGRGPSATVALGGARPDDGLGYGRWQIVGLEHVDE